MKFSLFGTFKLLLYVAGLLFVLLVAWYGREYYNLPLTERPHAELHKELKPSGFAGHGLEIVGSCMILLLFLYSLRKRNKLGLRFGRMNRWLDIHIWFGIIGPLLITLHTAMKFNGIVSISYFSMMAVMLSGFIGRYVYMQIPRDETGLVLSLDQVDERLRETERELTEIHNLSRFVIRRIHSLSGSGENQRGLSALMVSFGGDLLRPFKTWRLGKLLKKENPEFSAKAVKRISGMAKEQSKLLRRKAVMNSMNSFFHLWHVFHKPFAVIMILIMFVHVTVVVLMGYKWIF
ncbi:MAG: hypothetical protein P1R58_01070 [bacterium]|nr:hypothetical protein [bacterium]